MLRWPYIVPMPFLLLVFLFVMVPVAEISLLIRIGGTIGPVYTIIFVIFTAVLGAYLVRQQGFATLIKLQEESSAGRVPAMQIAEGVALLFAGAVLLTPGFLTDALGFGLLIPAIRQAIIKWLFVRGITSTNHFSFKHTHSTAPGPHIRSNDAIEGEYSDHDDRK